MLKTMFATLLSLLLTSSSVVAQQDAHPASAPMLDDAAIFAIFDEVNSVDIWTARLGVKKGQSVEVRDLARSVASDHEQVQQMMRDLARKLSINPVPPDRDNNAEDHAKAIAILQGKSSREFDRAYLRHEIEFHKGAVNAVKQTLLPAIHNQEFRELVEKVLPGLEHHLAETVATARRLGYE